MGGMTGVVGAVWGMIEDEETGDVRAAKGRAV
jgi:hypothetical protein